MARYKQGIYRPKNKEKWVGDQIVYRSSWELHFFLWADTNPNVSKIASEEFFIPYFYEIDGKTHRYFPDCLIEYKDIHGNIKTVLVEIKPYAETMQPKKTGKKSDKTFLNEVLTYEKNKAKWNAAKKWCQDKGLSFMILTEYELGLKKGR